MRMGMRLHRIKKLMPSTYLIAYHETTGRWRIAWSRIAEVVGSFRTQQQAIDHAKHLALHDIHDLGIVVWCDREGQEQGRVDYRVR